MGLVQYDSSDEDDDVQSQVEPQARKTPTQNATPLTHRVPEPAAAISPPSPQPPHQQPPSPPPPEPSTSSPPPFLGPTFGPSRPPPQSSTTNTLPEDDQQPGEQEEIDLSFLNPPTSPHPPNNHTTHLAHETEPEGEDIEPPRSPYTTTRTLLRDLTLPAVPNMDIPASPPPSGNDAEEEAHNALTAKVENFLKLKREKEVHFNARLAASAGMRNPGVMGRLLGFVGVRTYEGGGDEGGGDGETDGGDDGDGGLGAGRDTEQYTTVLSADVWDPRGFPAWAYRGALRRAYERGVRERERGRGEPVEFVPAAAAAGSGGDAGMKAGSRPGSRAGTPGVTVVASGKRKSRFDA